MKKIALLAFILMFVSVPTFAVTDVPQTAGAQTYNISGTATISPAWANQSFSDEELKALKKDVKDNRAEQKALRAELFGTKGKKLGVTAPVFLPSTVELVVNPPKRYKRLL